MSSCTPAIAEMTDFIEVKGYITQQLGCPGTFLGGPGHPGSYTMLQHSFATEKMNSINSETVLNTRISYFWWRRGKGLGLGFIIIILHLDTVKSSVHEYEYNIK